MSAVNHMNIATLDWVVIGGYFVIITAIGLIVGRRVRHTGEYFLGGRRFGPWLMMAQSFGVGTHAERPVLRKYSSRPRFGRKGRAQQGVPNRAVGRAWRRSIIGRSVMPRIVLTLLGDLLQWLALGMRSHTRLAAENLVLRKQLAFYAERRIKPRRLDEGTRLTLGV
jgi:hypothetical protein